MIDGSFFNESDKDSAKKLAKEFKEEKKVSVVNIDLTGVSNMDLHVPIPENISKQIEHYSPRTMPNGEPSPEGENYKDNLAMRLVADMLDSQPAIMDVALDSTHNFNEVVNENFGNIIQTYAIVQQLKELNVKLDMLLKK
jgi:hypothetical protein